MGQDLPAISRHTVWHTASRRPSAFNFRGFYFAPLHLCAFAFNSDRIVPVKTFEKSCGVWLSCGEAA